MVSCVFRIVTILGGANLKELPRNGLLLADAGVPSPLPATLQCHTGPFPSTQPILHTGCVTLSNEFPCLSEWKVPQGHPEPGKFNLVQASRSKGY
jgi:hypothetical protein